MRNTRVLLIAGLVAVTAAANAASFVFTGTAVGSSASPIVAAQAPGGTAGAILFTSETFTYTVSAATSTGSIVLSNASGSITGAFSGNYSVSGPGKSFGGTVSFTSGTGAYAGYVGTGTFATNITTLTPGTDLSVVSVNADVAPVPEPATLGVLGLGIVGLIRRRKA